MTTDDQRREALRRAVGGVLFNASNYPEKVQARLLGQDTRPLTDKVVDAILALERADDDERVARLMAIVTPLGYSSALALIQAETRMLTEARALEPIKPIPTDADWDAVRNRCKENPS